MTRELKWSIRLHSLFFLLLLVFLHDAAIAGDLTVVEGVWTTGVDKDSRQYKDRLDKSVPAQPLYFWTRLKGGRESLEWLAKNGKLPIMHEWIFSNAIKKSLDSVDPQQEGKSLSAGHISDTGGLASLVNKDGQFLWRTWSNKESVWRGTWVVAVKYADGEPVMCGPKACRWLIVIK
jgi:hypothetical protein